MDKRIQKAREKLRNVYDRDREIEGLKLGREQEIALAIADYESYVKDLITVTKEAREILVATSPNATHHDHTKKVIKKIDILI